MHSVKHTVIAVILLGVSFGLYQVSLTPSNEGHSHPGDRPNAGLANDQSLFESSRLATDPPLNSGNSTGALVNSTVSGTTRESISIPELPPFNPPQDGPTTPADLSKPSIPQLPAFPAAQSKPIHLESKEPAPSSDGLTNFEPTPSNDLGDRKPLDSTIENGVQSIHYPDLAKPESADSSKVVQREPLKDSGDQGLIEALKTHSPNPTKDSQDFVATIPQATHSIPSNNFVSTIPPSSRGADPDSNLGGDKNPTEFVADLNAAAIDPNAASALSESFKPESAATPGSLAPVANPIDSKPVVTRSEMSAAELSQFTYKTVWPKVDELVEVEDYYTALKLLSRFYRDETLNGPQRQRLLAWLDALAGKVIFSAEDHLTGAPYAAPTQESLAEIAKRWQVPTQLIVRMQGESLVNREVVSAGTRLKEIRGPFHAELKLKARVITLYLGDLYAGRFPVVIGTSGEPHPGEFDVVLKSESGFKWYDIQGNEYPPGAPENGYGPHWIGFSESLCLHAVAEDTAEGHRGCIGLLPEDAADLFSILSDTSKLIIVP